LLKYTHSFLLVLLLVFSIQCSHTESTSTSTQIATPSSGNSKNVPRTVATDDWLSRLPGDGAPYYDAVLAKVTRGTKGSPMTPESAKEVSTRIAKYMGFLMHNYDEIHKNEEGSATEKARLKAVLVKKTMDRLFKSSTQFLLCKDLLDFSCIEQFPSIQPGSANRQEDPELKLGERVLVKESLESSIEWYFNDKIMIPEDEIDLSKTIASVLEEKIKTEGKDAIYGAIYGMDDVTVNDKRRAIGSLSGVYKALIEKINKNVDVRAVFDHKGISAGVKKPLIFTYVEPREEARKEQWILSSANDAKNENRTNMDFQYNEGTQGLILALADGAKVEEDATGRIEWKNDGIMHNKFFIFRNGKQLSLWTGTANISRTCMGSERNSNMSVFVKNNEIAQTFLDEFNEMYEFQNPMPKNTSADYVGATGKNFPQGLFHGAKRPNTKRYFYFEKDKAEARVYFSPTDDAEHRAILPMLHSAEAGDVLRISMFGAAGIEYVRALQHAAARGVKVEVIVDSPTACGPGSWAGKSGDATLLEQNPFQKDAVLVMKKNKKMAGNVWKQNHQKIGILIKKGKPEQIIFGSQNWSNSGNDKNDENLMAFTKKGGDLKIAAAFDKHFTSYLWPKGEVIPEAGCSGDPGETDEESE
jgi:phosphatidylserine/phosphatidylglycerophosphate/cardiolipin synthase-like enzyme